MSYAKFDFLSSVLVVHYFTGLKFIKESGWIGSLGQHQLVLSTWTVRARAELSNALGSFFTTLTPIQIMTQNAIHPELWLDSD